MLCLVDKAGRSTSESISAAQFVKTSRVFHQTFTIRRQDGGHESGSASFLGCLDRRLSAAFSCGPETPTAPRAASLPGAILRPWVLLPVWVLPQFLLLVINLQAWGLAAEEVSPSQHTMAVTILFAELISLLGGIATTGALWLAGSHFQPVPWGHSVGLGRGLYGCRSESGRSGHS